MADDPEEREIALAEGHIRADYREGKIDKWQFQKEMLIMARARAQLREGDKDERS